MNYYSVFDKNGKKISDCASITDAIMLVELGENRTYRQIKNINPETVNVSCIKLADDLQLSEQKILPQSELEPFIVWLLQNKTMTKKIDFKKYQEFVDAVTSDASKDFLSLTERMVELDQKGANIERLLTAGVGMNAEAGEFLEIIKKMLFQGKPWNQDNKEHLIIELGDVIWYITQACIALGVSLDEVISGNVDKLMKRYPGGNFDVYYSENRDVNDR